MQVAQPVANPQPVPSAPDAAPTPPSPLDLHALPPLTELQTVSTRAEARAAVELLCTRYRDCVFACDTEVSHIDVSSESPVGHGHVICFSIYTSTSDTGEGALLLWVDTLLQGDEEEAGAIFDEFKTFFEDDSLAKVRVSSATCRSDCVSTSTYAGVAQLWV